MSGVRGYMGWRWVFILEGLITSVVAIILFFFISDFPEEVKWLTDEERAFVRAKLARDVGKSAHQTKIGARQVLEVFKDCKSIIGVLKAICADADTFTGKVIIGGFMYFGLIVPAYG
jgi:MFS family permease